jgi:type IV secretory pathway VirB4 component
MNFLTCQSRKFQNKLYYFGHHRSGNIFINSINGNYLSVTKKTDDPKCLKMNPLFLDDNSGNRAFLKLWFDSLVTYGKSRIDKNELKILPKIVDKIIDSNVKKLGEAIEFFNSESTINIYQKLSIWHGKGKYAFIFDHDEENNLSDNLVNAFNITLISEYKSLVIPVSSYLMHKIETLLDGSKAMIVLDEAWRLLDNYITGPKINEWLVRLRKKNCMVVFATESIDDISTSNITSKINHNISTQIFLPDLYPTEYYQTVFGLNDNEFSLLSAMSKDEHNFLLKYGGDSVVASLDLSALKDNIPVLSAKFDVILIMEQAMNKVGTNPKKWLPEFFKMTKSSNYDTI